MFDGVVMLSTNAWQGIWHRGHYLARLIAQRVPVLYVEPRPALNPRAMEFQPRRWVRAYLGRSFSAIAKNLYLLTPRNLPLGRVARVHRFGLSLYKQALKSALERLGWRRPLFWVYYYQGCLADLRLMGSVPLVYDCVDYSGREEEVELTRLAGLVLVCNRLNWEQKRLLNPRAYWVSNGVDMATFERAKALSAPPDIDAVPTPRLGLAASLNRSIQYSWLLHLARRRPDFALVFIGRLWQGHQFGITRADGDIIRGLRSCGNVYWLGSKGPSELPRYIRALDVGLVAYKNTTFDRLRDPLKVYQYLAAGKPVVSTPLTSFERTPPGVYTAAEKEEFCHQVAAALAELERERAVAERLRFARQADWEERFKLIERALEEVFPEWAREGRGPVWASAPTKSKSAANPG